MKHSGAPSPKDKVKYAKWWWRRTTAGRRCASSSAQRSKKWRQLNPDRYRLGIKKWVEQHPGFIREYGRKYRQAMRPQQAELKMRVFTYYGGNPPKCACCGESELVFLNIDHKKGDGAEHRRKLKVKSGAAFYRWLVKSKFPDGFQVLCYNCNFAKRTEKECPHQKIKAMPKTEQKFSKTPFKKQADVIAAILRTNPMLNEDEKRSMQETVGVLIWLNQLQLHWGAGGENVPANIHAQIFEGRKPEKVVPPGIVA